LIGRVKDYIIGTYASVVSGVSGDVTAKHDERLILAIETVLMIIKIRSRL
jgi:hypothetical protein